jgi:hypothetical protein
MQNSDRKCETATFRFYFLSTDKYKNRSFYYYHLNTKKDEITERVFTAHVSTRPSA